MVTFGADPDKDSTWDERPPGPKRVGNKQLFSLINKFAYHKSLRMSQRMNDEDKAILAGFFARKLRTGVPSTALVSLIDLFYASPYAASDYPAKMFVSNKVQDELLSEVEGGLSNDFYFDWLSSGMPNDDRIDECRDIRKILLLESTEGILRYPDVVVGILKSRCRVSEIEQMLVSLEDLIAWNLGVLDRRPDTSLLSSKVDLPKILKTNRRSPLALRPAAPDVATAIYQLDRKKQ